MIIAEHCKLCDHKVIDFNTGVLCSLTNKKPDFTHKCNVIILEENYKSQIKEINVEYEALLKTRVDVYGLFIIYIIIALFFFVGGYLLGAYIFESGVISTVPFLIMGVGIFPLGKAFGPLNYYFQSLKIAKMKKSRVDQLGLLYGFNYEIDIEHLKDSLGNKSYEVDLNLRRTNNTANN